MTAISIRGLTKNYGRVKALKGIDLELRPGELVALIGPNGAGKSTTLKLLTGQMMPTSGEVFVSGINVQEQPGEARRLIGYVPEEPALYDYLTAREFLEFIASIRGVDGVEEALAFTELDADGERLIREYSQGMRRKTALAAAILAKPPVLVLDEALNGLDPPSAVRVKKRLRELCDEGACVLLSTHVLDTAERLADRVVMISEGAVVVDEKLDREAGSDLEALFLERMPRASDD
ncbi:MAG: ABC transporter ATP-binding protein [Myxococcota bacterium]|nr:ABC transporter ATP-binding protein [Myxococcota bacterium]